MGREGGRGGGGIQRWRGEDRRRDGVNPMKMWQSGQDWAEGRRRGILVQTLEEEFGEVKDELVFFPFP